MQPFQRKIRVNVGQQRLFVLLPSSENPQGEVVERDFTISTSRFGLGSEPGSYRTPLGRFEVSEKFGDDAPLGAVFKGRVFTGEVAPFFDPEGEEDLVTTRILWLHGLEPGNANTKERYVYIHGTNHEESIGLPASHGCIRMKNAEIAELYPLIPVGTVVEIVE